jgi:hypothetical protein
VHRNNILIYIQQDATLHSLFYPETSLHVSGGTSTQHQERKQLYLQHLVFFTQLLLRAAIAVGNRPARPRTTALLSPRSDGKSEAATAVVVAPDDGHEDARNMLSYIYTTSNKLEKLLHLVG